MEEKIDNTRNYHIRQQGLIHPDKLKMPIHVIGAGSIGSWTTLGLAKMGCKDITVSDFDRVESHNIGSQIYGIGDIGEPKVTALVDKISLFIDTNNGQFIGGTEERVEHADPEQGEIWISAVDNMSSRKSLFANLLKSNNWFIDGRMAGNEVHIFSIKTDNEVDCAYYESNLFTDEEAVKEDCSQRSVVYNVFVIAGLITDIVATIANGQIPPRHLTVDLKNFHMEGGFI